MRRNGDNVVAALRLQIKQPTTKESRFDSHYGHFSKVSVWLWVPWTTLLVGMGSFSPMGRWSGM